MHLSMYRDVLAGRELVADIEFEPGKSGTFSYDEAYVARAKAMGELGISERLPVDSRPYAAEEFGPFFRGLLPEGSVYGNLAQMYQVPRNDYLSIIARLGCESIGALTFVADGIDPGEYEPHFEPLTDEMVRSFGEGPLRAVTRMTSETRLSLSGAQSKVAWCIEEGVRASEAEIADWSVPRGTAPSSHIIKVSAPGEEEIAYNELVCSLIARACGMEVACVDLLPFLPGAIAVQRYDRQWVSRDGKKVLLRLHQEDFCQALGAAASSEVPGGRPRVQLSSAHFRCNRCHVRRAESGSTRVCEASGVQLRGWQFGCPPQECLDAIQPCMDDAATRSRLRCDLHSLDGVFHQDGIRHWIPPRAVRD